MAVNQVIYGGETIIDISDSNLTEDTMLVGTIGYNAAGEQIAGTMPTAEQATPSISVDINGKITASAEQEAGCVSAGTKSATKQLDVQAARTITPSTIEQTAVAQGRFTTGAVKVGAIPDTYVKPTATKGAATITPGTADQTIAAGTYLSGAQTIKGDANLVAENIAEGVSIFGVAGTHSGGSSEGENVSGWINVLSLPTAYAVNPDSGGYTCYYEVPEDCVAIVALAFSVLEYGATVAVSRKESSGRFADTIFGSGASISDVDGTGTVLKIVKVHPNMYIYPVLSSDLS